MPLSHMQSCSCSWTFPAWVHVWMGPGIDIPGNQYHWFSTSTPPTFHCGCAVDESSNHCMDTRVKRSISLTKKRFHVEWVSQSQDTTDEAFVSATLQCSFNLPSDVSDACFWIRLCFLCTLYLTLFFHYYSVGSIFHLMLYIIFITLSSLFLLLLLTTGFYSPSYLTLIFCPFSCSFKAFFMWGTWCMSFLCCKALWAAFLVWKVSYKWSLLLYYYYFYFYYYENIGTVT